jgi:hypothetical protein
MARLDAKPGDWQTRPMPATVAALPFARSFAAEELALLRRGLVPEAMEDKWFVVWHDDALWLHRSWTGLCVYRLRFAPDAGGRVRVVEALVNRDPQQYCPTDAHDLATLPWLLDSLLAFAAGRR